MSRVSRLVKIAGIINCIIGTLAIQVPIYGIMTLLIGVLLYLMSSVPDKLNDNRILLLILCIICIPINLISSILIFCAFDNIIKYNRINGINAPPENKNNIDGESKKIDLLIKLGVGMVFVSGILFATTTWDLIGIIGKALTLVIFGIFFICLSLFTEKKLKLEKSSYLYWLLGVSFFLLTVIGILYFGVAGEYLKYSGLGSNIAYFITYIVVSVLASITYLKYKKEYLLYVIYSGLFIALGYILASFKVTPIIIVCVISVISFIINILGKEKKTLFRFNKVLSLILFALAISNISGENDFKFLLASVISIINLNSILIVDSDEQRFPYILLTYILIFTGIINIQLFEKYVPLFISLSTAIYTLIIIAEIIPNNKKEKIFSYILFSIIILISFISSCYKLPLSSPFIMLIFVLINEIIKYGLFETEKLEIARYIEPLTIIGLIISFQINLPKYYYISISFAVSTLLFCIMNFICKNTKDKNIYFIIGLLTAEGSLILNILDNSLIAAFIIIISAFLLFIKEYEKNDNKGLIIITYIIFLTSIYFPFVMTNILGINVIIAALIFIFMIIIASLILKSEPLNDVGLFYIIMPILSVLNYCEFSYEQTSIVYSILFLYLIFILLKLFIKDSAARNVIAIVGTIFCLSNVFFINSTITGIYIGIVAIIIIIIGFVKNELSPLFKFGVILTIINIVFQLRELWQYIPFWLYLLLGGLTVIGIVTFNEIKKQNNKELKDKKS